MNQTVIVSEDAETVYHATMPKGWVGYLGHVMEIGDLKFSIVPKGNLLIVSDYYTGVQIHLDNIPEEPETKEESVFYFQTILAHDVMMKIRQRGIESYKERMDKVYSNYANQHGINPMLSNKEETS